MRILLGLVPVAAVAVLWPEAASACASCIASQGEDVATTFIVTTGFLTFLPLAMAAGFFWYLRRRLRQLRKLAQ